MKKYDGEGSMMGDTIVKTPLYDCHIALGGKMIEFGNWYMPVQYAGIKQEHCAIRNGAGLFDVCHMGQILVDGEDALKFIQRVSTNDARRLHNGQIQYSFLCNQNGGIIDDFLLYRITRNSYLFVVNAGNTIRDYAHLIDACNGDYGEKARILNISYHIGMIALQGPGSAEIMEKLTGKPLGSLRYYHFLTGEKVMGGKKIDISRTGYTGEDGFEILCERDDTLLIWEKLLEIGKDYGLIPCGLGARDTLRLEAGMPLHGHELDENHTPIEAGLERYIGFDKKEYFLGKDVFWNQKKYGVKKRLIKFIMKDNHIARHGCEIYFGDKLIGLVTSGSPSITLGENIGMGYVDVDYSGIGSDIRVGIRGSKFPAKIKEYFRKK